MIRLFKSLLFAIACATSVLAVFAVTVGVTHVPVCAAALFAGFIGFAYSECNT